MIAETVKRSSKRTNQDHRLEASLPSKPGSQPFNHFIRSGRKITRCRLIFLLLLALGGDLSAQGATVRVAFNATDCTANIQAALNDPTADTIIIPYNASNWITRPLFLSRNNVTLKLESGVALVAKNGGFPGSGDCLLSVQGSTNILITGYGATIRMLNGTDSAYTTSEHRHGIALNGVLGVVIEGVVITKAGGDGIYVSQGSNRTYSGGVTIQNCVLDDNRRLGIGVISAQDFVLQHSVLSNNGVTSGTDPMSGIDFEPNTASQRIANCAVRDCSIYGNNGTTYASGIHSYLNNLGSTVPVSIRVERCHITSTVGGGDAVALAGPTSTGPTTTLVMSDCLIEDTRGSGLYLKSVYANTTVQITNTVLRNTFTDSPAWGGTPIYFGRAGGAVRGVWQCHLH